MASETDRARDLALAEALLGLSRVATTLSTRLRAVHADETSPLGPQGLGWPGRPSRHR